MAGSVPALSPASFASMRERLCPGIKNDSAACEFVAMRIIECFDPSHLPKLSVDTKLDHEIEYLGLFMEAAYTENPIANGLNHYIDRSHNRGKNQTDMIEEMKRLAQKAADAAFTTRVGSEALFRYIDGGEGPAPTPNLRMSALFCKHVAHISVDRGQLKPRTWQSAASHWGATLQATSTSLQELVARLPLAGLLVMNYGSMTPVQSKTFREFVDDELIESFEFSMGCKMGERLRAQFKEELDNEVFRYQIVDFLRGIESIENPWTRAAEYVRGFKERFDLPETAPLFSYVFCAAKLPEIPAGSQEDIGDLHFKISCLIPQTENQERVAKRFLQVLVHFYHWGEREDAFFQWLDLERCEIPIKQLKRLAREKKPLYPHAIGAMGIPKFLNERGMAERSSLYLLAVESGVQQAHLVRAKELAIHLASETTEKLLTLLINIARGWSTVAALYGRITDVELAEALTAELLSDQLSFHNCDRPEPGLYGTELEKLKQFGRKFNDKMDLIDEYEAFTGIRMPDELQEELYDDSNRFEGFAAAIRALGYLREQFIDSEEFDTALKIPFKYVMGVEQFVGPYFTAPIQRDLDVHVGNTTEEPSVVGRKLIDAIWTSFTQPDNELFSPLAAGSEAPLRNVYGQDAFERRIFWSQWVKERSAFRIVFFQREESIGFGVEVPIELNGQDSLDDLNFTKRLATQLDRLYDYGEFEDGFEYQAFCRSLVLGIRKAIFRLVTDPNETDNRLSDPHQFKVTHDETAASPS